MKTLLLVVSLAFAAPAFAQEFPCSAATSGTNCRKAILSAGPTHCAAGDTDCELVSTISVNRTACASAPLVDVNVALHIVHRQVGDLKVSLVHPDNTVVKLLDHSACLNEDVKTLFTDQGGGASCAVTIPAVKGGTKGKDSLATLNGKQANGVWKLIVRDDAASAEGFLDSWSLQLPCSLPTITLAVTDADADFTGSNTGAFTVTRAGGDLSAPLEVGLIYGGDLPSGLFNAPFSAHFDANATTTTMTVAPRGFDNATTARTLTAGVTIGEYISDTNTVSITVNPVGPPPNTTPVTVTEPTPLSATSGCGCHGTSDTSGVALIILFVARSLRRRSRAA